jgi:hypothetical protein
MSKTQQEIDNLKTQWLADPNWDIEQTEGFEQHREELAAFGAEFKAKWEKQNAEAKLKALKNAPAFPQIETGTNYGGDFNGNIYSEGGLTKREYFAAMAMQGYAQNVHSQIDLEIYPRKAVQIADALIAALNEEVKNG